MKRGWQPLTYTLDTAAMFIWPWQKFQNKDKDAYAVSKRRLWDCNSIIPEKLNLLLLNSYSLNHTKSAKFCSCLLKNWQKKFLIVENRKHIGCLIKNMIDFFYHLLFNQETDRLSFSKPPTHYNSCAIHQTHAGYHSVSFASKLCLLPL